MVNIKNNGLIVRLQVNLTNNAVFFMKEVTGPSRNK